jgi:hypothetical protein
MLQSPAVTTAPASFPRSRTSGHRVKPTASAPEADRADVLAGDEQLSWVALIVAVVSSMVFSHSVI